MSSSNPTHAPDWSEVMIDRLVHQLTSSPDIVEVGGRRFRCCDSGEAMYAVEIIRDAFSAALADVPRYEVVSADPFKSSPLASAEKLAGFIGQIGGAR